MTLNLLFEENKEDSLSGNKWHALRKAIVKSLLVQGDSTISDLSINVQSSIPTVTKVVNELLVESIVQEVGKIMNTGGRRPSLYSIVDDSGYLLGLDVRRNQLSLGLQNIKNRFIAMDLKKSFNLEESDQSLDELILHVKSFLAKAGVERNKVLGICVSTIGRTNSEQGMSDKPFFNQNRPFAEELASRIGVPVYLENDTRAMAWGEYAQGNIGDGEDVIFLNYDWGVSVGFIVKGQLYYGQSGYSGEFGHSPILNNGVNCYCGQKGCLETEISGWSLVQQFEAEIAKGRQSLVNIKDSDHPYKKILHGALVQEDALCLDLITAQCEKMGKYLAVLINLFNPATLIIGGDFAQLGDVVLKPIEASIKKHSVSLLTKDIVIRLSEAGEEAPLVGACYVVKDKILTKLS